MTHPYASLAASVSSQETESPLLPASLAAEIVNVPISTFRLRLIQGVIPFVQAGKVRLVRLADAQEYARIRKSLPGRAT